MDDMKIIMRCQIGQKDAFQELISIYHPFVYKFLVKISGNEVISEDLTQETFIKIINNIEKFDTRGKAKFSTYVITIAKNTYIDYLRKERKMINYVSVEESFNIEDINSNIENLVIDKIYNKDILGKLENLMEEQKLVIKLKYIEGLTLKEISDKLSFESKNTYWYYKT